MSSALFGVNGDSLEESKQASRWRILRLVDSMDCRVCDKIDFLPYILIP